MRQPTFHPIWRTWNFVREINAESRVRRYTAQSPLTIARKKWRARFDRMSEHAVTEIADRN